MKELTPEKRAELRALIAKSELADDEAAIAHALLDAAEERDRLRAEVDDLRDCYQSAHDPKSVGNIAWLAERYREGMDLAKTSRDELREQVMQDEYAVRQLLGKALGYPWFKDDPKNFPDATESDGVCVGEHVAVTLAMEAVRRITALEAENWKLRSQLRGLAKLRESTATTAPKEATS